MIIDRIENLGLYKDLHPLFATAIDYLTNTDLLAHETGKVVLKEGELYVNFDEAKPKAQTEARCESHNAFIDIQLPLSGAEIMGYAPRVSKEEGIYDEEKDITFY